MARRKRVADAVQAEVLVKSRRRCCVCFGLNRDDTVKQGQIAHLDKNPYNDKESNLVFLCLDHHDQFDSTTRQSKNLTSKEVDRYRLELYQRFSFWTHADHSTFLFNYLAASIDIEDIARTLWKIGRQVTAFPDFPIKLALTEKEVDLIDGEFAIPLLYVLDSLSSWGFVTYEFEQPDEHSDHFRFKINHMQPDTVRDLMKAVLEVKPREWH